MQFTMVSNAAVFYHFDALCKHLLVVEQLAMPLYLLAHMYVHTYLHV